ncbi:MAG: porin family protein [Rhizobiaceae bacterium]|jgi:opacity protein-like surface antigen|nr:porin family protein [Rhizobiaceae bacterium]
MVHSRVSVAAVAALLSSISTLAMAADIIDPPVIEAPILPIIEPVKTGGWYIRGDVGYSMTSIGDIHYDTFDPIGGNFSTGLLRGELSDGAIFGGGIGYDTGHYLRFDLTADYQQSKFKGNSFCGPAGAICTDDTQKLSALSLLANAYVDLGHFNGFTPYVGAGIGGTHVNWGTLTNDCRPGVDPALCTDDTHPGGSEWRFTYAAMAGVSYDVTDCLAIDAGYRYRNIAGGKMFGIAHSGNPGSGYDKGIDAHDFRLGARYTFGGKGGTGCGAKPQPIEPYEPIEPYKPVFK